MTRDKSLTFGCLFFLILGIACIGKSCSDEKRQKRVEKERERIEREESRYPSNLYQMSPEEYRAFYEEWRKLTMYPGIRMKPDESYEEYSKRAAAEVEKMLGYPNRNKRPNRLRMQQSYERSGSHDETDIMEHLSNVYDAYMDYDPYDADVSPTGNPEEDEIFFYEAFIEGDGGEWEMYEEGAWDE